MHLPWDINSLTREVYMTDTKEFNFFKTGTTIFTKDELAPCYEEIRDIFAPVLNLEESKDFKLVPKVEAEAYELADKLIKPVRNSKLLIDFVFSSKNLNSYAEKLNAIFDVDDFQLYPLASKRIRVNYPKISRAYTNWHQDMGTWCTAKDNLWDKFCITIWVPFTDVPEEEGGLEFYKDSSLWGLTNYVRTKTNGAYSAIPGSSKLERECFSVQAGNALLFDSLMFHRSVPSQNFARVSFDVRFYSPKVAQMIQQPKISTMVKMKRNIPGVAKVLRHMPLGL